MVVAFSRLPSPVSLVLHVLESVLEISVSQRMVPAAVRICKCCYEHSTTSATTHISSTTTCAFLHVRKTDSLYPRATQAVPPSVTVSSAMHLGSISAAKIRAPATICGQQSPFMAPPTSPTVASAPARAASAPTSSFPRLPSSSTSSVSRRAPLRSSTTTRSSAVSPSA